MRGDLSSCGHAGNRGIVTPKPMKCKRFRIIGRKANENADACSSGSPVSPLDYGKREKVPKMLIPRKFKKSTNLFAAEDNSFRRTGVYTFN